MGVSSSVFEQQFPNFIKLDTSKDNQIILVLLKFCKKSFFVQVTVTARSYRHRAAVCTTYECAVRAYCLTLLLWLQQSHITGCNKKNGPPDHFASFRPFLQDFFKISSTKLTKSIKSELFGVRRECTVIKNNLLGSHFRI